MNFKQWLTSSKEDREENYLKRKEKIDANYLSRKDKIKEASKKRKELATQRRYTAYFRLMTVKDGQLITFQGSVPILDCTIDIIDGAGTSRMTATRVLTGGALAGGGGAVMGSLSKKDTTTFYMVIDTGVALKKIKFTSKESAAAQHFALCFGKEQERIRNLEQ